VNNSG